MNVIFDQYQFFPENVASDNAWACRSCYKFAGDGSAFNPALPWLGYIDVEFAGEVSFVEGASDPFNSIENVMGNVWRLTFNQIMTNIDFDLDVRFTGSLGMMPRVNWAQGPLIHTCKYFFLVNIPLGSFRDIC